MFLSRFNRKSLVTKFKLQNRSFSSTLAAPLNEIFDNLEIDEHRLKQLGRLQSVKPDDFTPVALNQLIADFLVSPKIPDTVMAGQLLNKFLFKVPKIDEKGELISLYLLQLVQNKEIATGAQFLKKILQEKECQIPLPPFMLECLWKGIIDSKADSIGFDLLKTIKESKSELITAEFTEQLILDLFLPRLNWPAIDYIVAESAVESQEITISASTLQEIFHLLLAPVPNDPYFDPLDSEPFTGNLVNPRFHRLLQILERWKNSNIPIKGKQISRALEESFKRFLPTEAMMNELQKLA